MRASSPNSASCSRRFGLDADLGRRSRPARAGRNWNDVRRKRPPQGACRRERRRHGRAGRRFRPLRRCARRRARRLHRRLGGDPDRPRLRDGDERVEDQLQARRRHLARPAQGLVQRHALPRRTPTGATTSMSAQVDRHDGLAAARRAGASASIRCSCPTASTSPSAKCRPRPSIPGRRARSGSRHRARAFAKFVEGAIAPDMA